MSCLTHNCLLDYNHSYGIRGVLLSRISSLVAGIKLRSTPPCRMWLFCRVVEWAQYDVPDIITN